MDQIKIKLYEKYSSKANRALVDTSILYVQKRITEKDKDTGKPKYNFGPAFLLQSIAECIDNGFALDGINYVLSGNRMYMPTYKAFKNKIYMVYPESEIDLQLIREGDTYGFAKESGSVVYTHEIADPFADAEPKIKGAYCIIKNKRGEFLETLNMSDYKAMRNGSKTPSLWDKWESEFWLKSVIKRACKRHFNDLTTALEEKDNEVIGLEEIVKASPDKKAAIIGANKVTNPKTALKIAQQTIKE